MTDFLKQTFGDAATDEIITSFKAELGKKFVAKADYNTKRDELKGARERIEQLELEVSELGARADDTQRLNQEMISLKERYEQHVSVLSGKLEQVKLEGEVGSLIRKCGGKNEKAVRALLNLDEENPMESAAQQLDLLKKSDPYLFDMPSPGTAKGNFPRNGSAQTDSLTYSQMMQLESNKKF